MFTGVSEEHAASIFWVNWYGYRERDSRISTLGKGPSEGPEILSLFSQLLLDSSGLLSRLSTYIHIFFSTSGFFFLS
jgi:hypothetical protein